MGRDFDPDRSDIYAGHLFRLRLAHRPARGHMMAGAIEMLAAGVVLFCAAFSGEKLATLPPLLLGRRPPGVIRFYYRH